MKRALRTNLYTSHDGLLEIQSARISSIVENPVAVVFDKKITNEVSTVEFFAKPEGSVHFPLLISDIVANGFLRQTYRLEDGRSATLGTSVLGSCSLRRADGTLFYIPQIETAALRVVSDSSLEITLEGSVSSRCTLRSTRRYNFVSDQLSATTVVRLDITMVDEFPLDKSLRNRDSFRLFTISSMFTPTHYDANKIQVRRISGDNSTLSLNAASPSNQHLVLGLLSPGDIVEAIKEPGSNGKRYSPGSPDSPSVSIKYLRSSGMHPDLGVYAFWTGSKNINDDSLTMWGEVQEVDALEAGKNIWVEFEVGVSPPY